LGFEPNGLARGLSEGRSGTVGMLTSDLIGRFSLPILMGAEDAFGAGEVSVFLCDARGDAIREQHHVRALLARQIDGLIVVGSSTDPRPPLSMNLPVPVIYAYAPSLRPEDTSVIADDVAAGRKAVEHMLQMGRHRIAHLSGDATYAAAQDRASGVRAALADAGLEPVGGHPYFGSWSERWGRTATELILTTASDIDGIVCANDQIARGALHTLAKAGVQVPDQVAVMGFDNWSVYTDEADPPLTSIDMNLESLGRRAAQLLAEAMDGRPHQGVDRLPCRVVVRESTGPARPVHKSSPRVGAEQP
jgi:LacI family transcriptional regulator